MCTERDKEISKGARKAIARIKKELEIKWNLYNSLNDNEKKENWELRSDIRFLESKYNKAEIFAQKYEPVTKKTKEEIKKRKERERNMNYWNPRRD